MTLLHTVPKSIPANQTDVSKQLNEWLNGLSDKTADVSFRRSQFRCESTIELVGKKNLRFRDGGIWASTQGDSHRAHWRSIGGSNLKWLNIRTVGPRKPFNPYDGNYQWQHGFDFQGLHGYNLAACIVQGVLGDGVCNGRGQSGQWTETGVITQTCKFLGTGRQTITFTAANAITVGAVSIEDPTLSIFDIEPNGAGWGATYITINGVKVSNTNPQHTYSLLYASDFVAGGVVGNITVQNCVEKGNGLVVVVRPDANSRYKDFAILNNQTDTPQTSYADIERVDNLNFGGNSIPQASVSIVDCT